MASTLRSFDGTELVADVVTPPGAARGVVLVHGGGVTRHEGGFYDRLADGLAGADVASLRFDLRGHGDSGGRQQELTLAGVGNDIHAALDHLAAHLRTDRVSLLGASFSGGICASLAARHGELIDRLVLINPLLDYKKRFVDDKDYWDHDHIDTPAASRLATDGYVAHSPTFRLGVALLNEVFWWNSRADLPHITAPTLVVHGTDDTFVPIDSSRRAMTALTCPSELIELDGAQHGVAVPDDPDYQQPQTRRWQAQVTAAVARWVTA